MAKIKILTDSTADLDESVRKKHGIEMIPLRVYFGDQAYKDGVDMKFDRFYSELQSNPNHPKTSQPTPEEFKAKYQSMMEDGSEVISIHISSKMSGTIQSATMAKNELNSDKIHIIGAFAEHGLTPSPHGSNRNQLN